MKYLIPYEVPAETHLEALIRAGELVRTGVTIEAVKRVEPSVPGWFFVDLEVSEPDAKVPHSEHEESVEDCPNCQEENAATWERMTSTY
jgi:hypothetical protein